MRSPEEVRAAVHEFLVVTAALRAGVLDAAAERPYDVKGLARVTGLDAGAVSRLVPALVRYGVLVETGAGLALTADARRAFHAVEGRERYRSLLMVDTTKGLLRLPDILRTGEHLAPKDDAVRLRNWIYAMRERPKEVSDIAAHLVMEGLPRGARVLDVGGGPGHMSRRFIEAGAEVTLLDLPDVIDLVRPDLEETAHLELVAGDATKPLPGGPYDAVYLGNITNMLGPGENQALFRNVRAALAPEGRVGIQVHLGGRSPLGELFSLLMFAFTPDGDAYRAERYAAWCETAGLAPPTVRDLDKEKTHQLLLSSRPA